MEKGAFANHAQVALADQRGAAHALGRCLGPCERAVKNTPILESGFKSSDDFVGIDVTRAVQSFDPCMPCSTRLLVRGEGRVLERTVTTG